MEQNLQLTSMEMHKVQNSISESRWDQYVIVLKVRDDTIFNYGSITLELSNV